MALILVLDDDRTSVQVLRWALESKPYHVIDVPDEEQATAVCRNPDLNVDLLLTDVFVPLASGTEAALRAREACENAASLFISGTPLEGWPEEDLRNASALSSGRVAFLHKPFTLDALHGQVEMLLNQQNSSHEFASSFLAAALLRQGRSEPPA